MKRSFRESHDMHAVVARLQTAQREQQRESSQLFRVFDEIGRPTDFIGTLKECNDKFGDRDVTFDPVSGGGN